MSYIGKTIQKLKTRIKQHRYKSSYCRCLSLAIKENGWENFEVSTLWEGDNSVLGDMERYYIDELNTLEPNGYNSREGGGRSENVSDISRQLMIDKQREISMRRNGLLGVIRTNYSHVDKDNITSYSVLVNVNAKRKTIGNFKTYDEALEVQKKFTEDPDNYEIPPSISVGNGQSTNVYSCSSDKRKKRWLVQFRVNGKNLSLGRYETKEEAIDARKRYNDDPHNFVRPNQRKPIHNT